MNHDSVAFVYDLLARLWSLGAIDAARALAPSRVAPGERVLFAGVGAGRDAAIAVQHGATVLGIDLSGRMLERARRVAGPGLRTVHGDALAPRPGESYDLVCAHYFLNVFGPDRMPAALDALTALVAPTGRLSIADFAPGPGLLRAVHFRLPLWTFRLLGLCETHPIYDYAPLLRERGWEVEITAVRLAGRGPAWHRVWTARRSEQHGQP